MTTIGLPVSDRFKMASCKANWQEIVEECTSPPSFPAQLCLVNISVAASDHSDYGSPIVSSPNTSKASIERSTLHHQLQFADRIQSRPTDDDGEEETEAEDAETQAYIHRTGEVEVSIKQCEKEWVDIAKERVKQRQQEFDAHSKMLAEQAKQNTNLLAQQLELKNKVMLQKIHEVQKESEQTQQRRLRNQQERQRLHVKRMDAKLRAAQQQKAKEEEAERLRRAAEMEACLKAMISVKHQIDEVAKRILGMLDGCRHKAHLPQTAEDVRKKVNTLCGVADKYVQMAQQQGASMKLVDGLQVMIEQMIQCQEVAKKVISEADRLGQEEAVRKAKEEEAKQKAAQTAVKSAAAAAAAAAAAPASNAAVATATAGASGTSQGAASLNKFVTADALKEYETIQQKLEVTVHAYQNLKSSADPQVKKFRNDIMKAVNTPINAISVQSGRQLLDQLRRLSKLLAGERVEISGGRQVSIAALPSGKAYCVETLARKLVAQCDKQISSNHETAFPFAAISVALWRDYPEVKDLMLAHFYKGCPFLLPYYIPKQEKMSMEDYYKALGYVYDSEGQVEAQDKYLKRLSGFMRLYAAIMATKPLGGGNQVHPFGPCQGWTWLSRIMNLEPQPDVTATMLHDFLEVCGNTLANSYGKQFFKLLQALCKHYFPKIEAVTPKGAATGGPVLRLKNFLETCIKTQKISPPKGLLTDEFWRS